MRFINYDTLMYTLLLTIMYKFVTTPEKSILIKKNNSII